MTCSNYEHAMTKFHNLPIRSSKFILLLSEIKVFEGLGDIGAILSTRYPNVINIFDNILTSEAIDHLKNPRDLDHSLCPDKTTHKN